MVNYMKTIFEPHPVSPERKRELRAKGYTIIDVAFAPKGYEHPEKVTDPIVDPELVGDALDDLDLEELHALAKERDVKVAHNAGADKAREALRAAEG